MDFLLRSHLTPPLHHPTQSRNERERLVERFRLELHRSGVDLYYLRCRNERETPGSVPCFAGTCPDRAESKGALSVGAFRLSYRLHINLKGKGLSQRLHSLAVVSPLLYVVDTHRS